MATTKSKIKQLNENLEQVYVELVNLQSEVKHPELQEDKEYLKQKLMNLKTKLAELMVLREEFAGLGYPNLPGIERGTSCHLLVSEISKELGSNITETVASGRIASVPISTETRITDQQLVRDSIASAPPIIFSSFAGPSPIYTSKQSETILTTTKPIITKPANIFKSIFNPSKIPIFAKTTAQYQFQNPPVYSGKIQNIQTMDYANITEDEQQPSTSHQDPLIYPLQIEEDIQPVSRYVKPFNLKWADKVPKFDGSFINFHSFINTFNHHVHSTDCDDSGKLLILREKLDPKSLQLIAGIREPNYLMAYNIIVRHYSESYPLQQKLKAKVQSLPEIRFWYQTEEMRSNLAVIKDVYNVLEQSESNRSFLETDFYFIVASKFPRDAIKDLMQKFGSKLTVKQYLFNLTMYIEQNEQQQTILSRTNYMTIRSNQPFRRSQPPRQNPFSRNPNPNRFNRNQPTRFNNPWSFSISKRQQNNQPKITFPGESTENSSTSLPLRIKYDNPTPSTSQTYPKILQQRSGTDSNSNQYKTNKCFFCGKNHIPINCDKPIMEKKRILSSQKRCLRCFSSFHIINQCPLRFTCRLCRGNHNTSICENKERYPIHNVNHIKKKEEGPTEIEVLLNDSQKSGLYDPGASHSFINKTQCKNLKSSIDPYCSKVKQAVSYSKISGKTKIKVKVGNIEEDHIFFVIPEIEQIIFGIDFIDKFKIIRLPYGEMFQYLDDELIPLKTNEEFKENDVPTAKVIQMEKIKDLQPQIQEVMRNYSDVFTDCAEIGRVRDDYCYINLKNNVPINLRPYRVSPVDQQIIDEQIEKLLEKKLIKPSVSNYSFPIVLADKKDEGKKTRLCVDYRKLNEVTITESYPMPLIQDIENKLYDASVFTTFDISAGFHHIPMAPEDCHKTAFVTMNEHYEWLVMPFGLKNAPAVFQRIIFKILKANELTKFAHNYIDDIIVFSKDLEEHIQHLEKILLVFRKERIILKFSKCKFASEEVNYLGHNIQCNQIRPLHSNKQSILSMHPPNDLKSLRRFIGKLNFYQRFIPNRTELLAPLYELLKKDVKFIWTEETDQAFKRAIEILSSDLVLGIFNYSKTTILISDASNIGIGAVLKQKETELDDDKTMVTIGYFSKKLHPYQINYSATEKECLAIIEALQFWHHYLYGNSFIIRTDHKPLKFINSTKTPNTRIMNWALKLSQYNYKIEYIPGKDNIEADCLSRDPNFQVNLLTLEEISNLQDFIQEPPPNCIRYNGLYVRYTNGRIRYYIPEDFAKYMIEYFHKVQGHIGQKQTALHFSQNYYTTNQNQIIHEIVYNCAICLQAKRPRKKLGKLSQIGPAKKPFEYVHIDTIGGLRDQGTTNRYFHVAIDAFTRYVWGLNSKTQGTNDFIKLIEEVKKDGIPESVVCDRYPALNSRRFREYLQENLADIIYIPVTHPATNGMVERFVQTFVERVRCKKIEHPNRSWSHFATDILKQYNSTVHTVTRFPPCFLLLGEDTYNIYAGESVYDLEDYRRTAFINSLIDHERNRSYYDKRRKNWQFTIGDWVFAKLADDLNRNKLDPRFEGPFEIIERSSDLVYVIDVSGNAVMVHVENLKPSTTRTGYSGFRIFDEEVEEESDDE
ncbi:hypothetical protein DERF_006553 [Dermatophagoides farinae]|uniref:RNA-directed DNA polymerase n=1 Tax=Dermatophagoides farinae TaxID=6954 RepID=A0A922LC70_DERFA|nr:hypothetical protein DERF_006553 [Dermatophagoides farinae]